jgi:enoyl-CoA hydratase
MTFATYETLLIEQFDRVARITLNRPERRNAISPQLQKELVAAVEECAEEPSVHAVVVRGAGAAFCAGYDMTPSDETDGYVAQISTPRRAVLTAAMGKRWKRLWDAPVPVIAQVHGHCLAGGTDLALNCDLVIVAEDATIGFPALRMGGTPPSNMWLYNLGPQWAKRLLYTGDTFTGRFAARIGFALEAVPADQLEERVMALATRVAAMGRDILAINKYVLNAGLDMMGRAVLQDFCGPMDTIANMAPEMGQFLTRSREIGLGPAFKERDAPFASGVPIDVGASQSEK